VIPLVCGGRRLASPENSGEDDRVRSRLLVVVGWLMLLSLAGSGSAAGAPTLRVSVQPLEGPVGAALRQQIARLLRGHGFQVLTSIPRVEGTGQYLTLARDHRLAAFVAGDLEEHRTRQTLTILIWDGAQGSVLARWSASGPARQLPRLLAKGFWKHLGPALDKARAPESNVLPPAPPVRMGDASVVD
jgi:hypothetical protein